MKFLTSIALTAATLLCVSCGVSNEYEGVTSVAKPYQTVLVGDFKYKVEAPTPQGAKLASEFPSVLAEELQNYKNFPKVAHAPSPGHALRVEGEVTLLDEGNSALRIGVGMGTGKSHFYCTTRFIDNATGKVLGTLKTESSSKNGLSGIADNFPVVRRTAAGEVAAQAASFAPQN